MHYVKHFDINGVDTKQVACIELHGKPNAATEGSVGVLGIDMDSPLHDVYKCVAVNGSIYSWELLSSGLSIMSATISGGGMESVQFPYVNLLTPVLYVVKIGDLILDSEGYLYQIKSIYSTECTAVYCGTQVVAYGKSAYDVAVKNGFEGSEEEWIDSLKGETGATGEQGVPGEAGKSAYEQAKEGGYTGTEAEFNTLFNYLVGLNENVQEQLNIGAKIEIGYYNGTQTGRNELTFSFAPKVIFIRELVNYANRTLSGFGIIFPEHGESARFSKDDASSNNVTADMNGTTVTTSGNTVIIEQSSNYPPSNFNVKSQYKGIVDTETDGYGYFYCALG